MMPIKLPDYIDITQTSVASLTKYLNENKYSRIFVLLDENTKIFCAPFFESLFKEAIQIEIKSGEINKTLETCNFIWETLTNENADRNALFINLGGGVIGDMGGFCASTYKRGIDFINIPTTLLSQVDASIGGKLGIDFNGFKNHIGLFNLPRKVIIDPIFLKTLPNNQLLSGFAEMLKHGFIKDQSHLEQLAQLNLSSVDWLPLIKKSIEVKNEIVTADPFEKDERKLLNFGHTIGHAVESYFINNSLPILHGEAVAIGMISEAYLSSNKVNLDVKERNKLAEIVDQFFERVEIPKNGLDEVLNNLIQDKKNEGSKVQSVLLTQIGKAKHSIEISKEEVTEAIAFYNAR